MPDIPLYETSSDELYAKYFLLTIPILLKDVRYCLFKKTNPNGRFEVLALCKTNPNERHHMQSLFRKLALMKGARQVLPICETVSLKRPLFNSDDDD